MHKISTFFYAFRRSLIDLTYYKELENTNFEFSFRYLTGFHLFKVGWFNLIFFIAATVALQRTPLGLSNYLTERLQQLPADYQLAVQDGKMTTNNQEAIAIDLPPLIASLIPIKNKHILLISPQEPIENFRQQDTLVLLNRDAMVTRFMWRTRILFWRDAQVILQITQNDLHNFLNRIRFITERPLVVAIMLALILTGVTVLAAFILAYVYSICAFVVAWVFYCVSLWLKKDLGHDDLTRMSMHALSWPLVIELLAQLYRPYLPAPPGVLRIIEIVVFIFWMSKVLSKFETKQTNIHTQNISIEPPGSPSRV